MAMSLGPPVDGEPVTITRERARRDVIWDALCRRYPRGRNVDATTIRELRITRSIMGIFYDKDVTRCAEAPSGIAVGLMWSDQYDEPPPKGNKFRYRYPETDRKGIRNEKEIQAVKAAAQWKLPVFIIDAVTDKVKRQIVPAWVLSWDDRQLCFLLSLAAPSVEDLESPNLDATPFELTTSRSRKRVSSFGRDGQDEFAFHCFKRYGEQCAICPIALRPLLDAAHIYAYGHGGSNDPRNSLPLCKLHHAAYDAEIITINPDTLGVEITLPGLTLADLNVTYASIEHLERKPHEQALRWAYERASATVNRRKAKTEHQRRYRLKKAAEKKAFTEKDG